MSWRNMSGVPSWADRSQIATHVTKVSHRLQCSPQLYAYDSYLPQSMTVPHPSSRSTYLFSSCQTTRERQKGPAIIPSNPKRRSFFRWWALHHAFKFWAALESWHLHSVSALWDTSSVLRSFEEFVLNLDCAQVFSQSWIWSFIFQYYATPLLSQGVYSDWEHEPVKCRAWSVGIHIGR